MRPFTRVVFLTLLGLPLFAQQALNGTFSGSFQASCSSSPGTFSTTLSATVTPSLSSLASSGGSFTGTMTGAGTAADCGLTESLTLDAALSGTVSAGGAVSITITGAINKASISGSASGTTASLTGQMSVTTAKGEVATGSISLTPGGGSGLTGSYSGGGPVICGDNSTGQESFSGALNATTQPGLSSLTASGGQFSGTMTGQGIVSASCFATLSVTVSGPLSGTVSPGGAVSWSFQANTVNSNGGSSTFSTTSGGTGTTSMLVCNCTIFDSSEEPSPNSINVVFTANGSGGSGGGGTGSGALQIPGGGGISPVTLMAGTVGTAYAESLTAVGGTAPYTWKLAGGSLPPGLTLSSGGFLSGTPTTAGGSQFTAMVTDSATATASSAFAVTIAPQPIGITTTSLPNGIVTTPYPSQVLTASGGTPPYTFQISDSSLPAGLTYSNGAVMGTPEAAGSFNIPVTVTDSSSPALTGSATLSLTVSAAHTDLVLSQNSVPFTIANGSQSLPAEARVNVQSNNPSQPIAYTVAVNPQVSWLSVTSGGTTPGAITLNLTPQALQLTANAQTSVTVTCSSSNLSAASPCAGNSQTIAVSLNVKTAAPQLVVTTPSLSFTASSANPVSVSQSLGLENAGGGSIDINSITAANSYLTVTGNPESLEGGPPSYLTVTLSPNGLAAGVYMSSVTVATSIETVTIPVTVLVAPGATMTLNPAGTIFNAVAGSLPGNPNGSFEVSVTGNSTVSYTAAVLPGASWLTLHTASGTSTAANPGSVSFTINSSLPAGAYYGAIQVSSPNVANSPQTFEVVFDVVSATTAVVPNPQPAGLLFVASSGTPAAQTVQIYAGSSTAQSYQAASDSTFISVSPATGTAASGSPGASSVSVNLQGLQAGVYTGGVSYAFAGAAVRTVNVTLIVEPGAVTSANRPGPTPKAATCAPEHLVPVENGLDNSFSQPAAWPTPLSILLVNDCGQPVTNGQVVATFSNGDPPLLLPATDTTSGNYSATWTPRATGQQVAITIMASAPPFPFATTQIAGQVTPNAAPIVFPNGTINAFAIAAEPGVPLAPGTIVAIYGSNLASGADSPGVVPLLDTVNQTSVIIGGMEAPLYYVSPTQINAQIPFELNAGSPYQLIVNANGALSTPYPIQLVADSPGIYQAASGGIIAQHFNSINLVTEASPAKPGEIITLYVLGMGATNQTVASGAASPEATVLDNATLTLGGMAVAGSNILYAGLTPTTVGLYQIDLQIPASAPNGDLQLVLTQASGVSNSTIIPVHN